MNSRRNIATVLNTPSNTIPSVDIPLVRVLTRQCAGRWSFRNSLRSATPLVLIAGVSMSTVAFQASAAEVSFQFSADLSYIDGTDHPEFAALFGIGDTLSGNLTYDTDLAPYFQSQESYGSFSFFDFLSAPALTSTLFVSELSHTTPLDGASLGIYTDGSGDDLQLYTVEESVAVLQGEQVGFGFYLADSDGGMLSTTDALPTDIDFNQVDYGGVYLFDNGMEFASADITAFFLDIGNNQEPTVDPDGNLILGATQPDFFTLEAGEVLQTNRTTVGLFEDSTFVQQDGTHTTAELLVGGDSNEWETGQGSYLLQGGTLNSGYAQVGPYGEGDFIQIGGTHNAEWLMIGGVGRESAVEGPSAIGIGDYTLTGGTLNVGLSGMTVGGFGKGSFSQSGGDVVIGSASIQHPSLGQLRIGTGPSQYDPDDFVIDPAVQRGGSYTLGNGTLTVYGQTILGSGSDYSGHNFGGRGEFSQTGGAAFIRDDLVVGEAGISASGTGQYVISGGALSVGGDIRVADNSAGGNAAEGLFFQTGGTVDVSGDIVIGASDTLLPNAYRIRGGSTTATQVEVGLGGTAAGQALLEVSNGGLLTSDVFINGNGVLMGDGGTIDGNITLNGGMLAPGSSPGTMTVTGDLFLLDGTLELEIGPGLFDQIIVGGNALFGDNLYIDLIFDSELLDTAFDLTGLFDVTGGVTIGDGFSLADNLSIAGLSAGTQILISLYDEQFTYSASAVPVPAAAWLLGSGLVALLGVSRRRYVLKSQELISAGARPACAGRALAAACLMSTLAFVAAAPEAEAATIDLTGDVWNVEGFDDFGNVWNGSTLVFESQVLNENGEDYDLTGYFDWVGAGPLCPSADRHRQSALRQTQKHHRTDLRGHQTSPRLPTIFIAGV